MHVALGIGTLIKKKTTGAYIAIPAPNSLSPDHFPWRNSFIKLGQGMCGMLKALAQLVGNQWALVSHLQVVGFLTSALNPFL